MWIIAAEVLMGDSSLSTHALWALTCAKYTLFAAYGLEIAASLGGVPESNLVKASYYASFLNLARVDVNQGPGLFYVLFLGATAWILLVSMSLLLAIIAKQRGM